MNFLIVVALFTIVAAVKAGKTKEEAMEVFRTIATGCAAETGATEADIVTMMKHIPATNMETKCLRACIMKKIEVMSPDGKFNKNAALKMSEPHTNGDPDKVKIAETVTNTCASIDVPSDHCEAAESYKMCLQSEAKKHGINIMD